MQTFQVRLCTLAVALVEVEAPTQALAEQIALLETSEKDFHIDNSMLEIIESQEIPCR